MAIAKLKVRNKASRQKLKFEIFDAKIRSALLASLRSAVFSEIKVVKKLVILSAGVKTFQQRELRHALLIFVAIFHPCLTVSTVLRDNGYERVLKSIIYGFRLFSVGYLLRI